MSRGRATPVLFALSLVLLTLAWLVANPPSAAPDETAHYIKALGAVEGQLAGKQPPPADRAQYIRREAAALTRGGEPPETALKGAEWFWRTSRIFQVPAGALSSSFDCNGQRTQVSWACLASGRPTPSTTRELWTYVGTYPPVVYVPSGALASLGGSPDTRLLLGRAGMAAMALLLLIAATFVLWDSGVGGLSLVGLVAAVTPMVVFVSSTLSTSGPEIASAICFAATLFRLAGDRPRPRWIWGVLAVSGLVLALSRQLGTEFIVLTSLVTLVLFGARATRRIFRGRGTTVAWVFVACACACGLLWDMLYGAHPPTTLGNLVAVIPSTVKQLATILREEIGKFGQLDSPLPIPAYVAWLAMLCGLLLVAFRISDRPLRARLGLIAVGLVGVTVLVSALQRQTGWFLQGRHALPIFILLPLAAGEVVRRQASRLSNLASKRLVLAMATTAGLVQAAAWFVNGRRVAVGTDGSWLYALSPHWQPPLGWLPWTAIVFVALVLYVLAGRYGTERLEQVPAVVDGTPGGGLRTSVWSRRPALAWLRSGRGDY